MGLFRRSREKEDARLNEQVLARIQGKAIKYVARRDVGPDGSTRETVLGKTGRINCLADAIVVVCDGREVFRCAIADAKCSELLSLDGAVIQGANQLTGAPDTVVAYYQYYR